MRNILAILIFTIFIYGCNDDVSLLQPSIELISPINETVDYCDIEFNWKENRNEGVFIIDISTTLDFDDVIFTDTTIYEVYQFSEVLEPNRRYFWRVRSGTEVEVGEFTTQSEPILNDFNGTFTVIKYMFNPAYFPMETYDTLSGEVQIQEDGSPTLILNASSSIETGFFDHRFSSCSTLTYYNKGFETGETYAKYGNLDLLNRTFSFAISETRPAAQIFVSYSGSID